MLTKNQLTTFLQIFLQFMINYKAFFKSNIGPDDICHKDQWEMG